MSKPDDPLKRFTVTVAWSDPDQTFIARVEGLGIATHGDTPELAVSQARTATKAALDLLDENRDMPSS